jgi:hypothetical protein
MSFLSSLLQGAQISHAYSDHELTYLMLADGTQVTIRGVVIVEPAQPDVPMFRSAQSNAS